MIFVPVHRLGSGIEYRPIWKQWNAAQADEQPDSPRSCGLRGGAVSSGVDLIRLWIVVENASSFLGRMARNRHIRALVDVAWWGSGSRLCAGDGQRFAKGRCRYLYGDLCHGKYSGLDRHG